MTDNIFTALIGILNTVQVAGEENMAKMVHVFNILRQMEAASKKPDNVEGEQDG